MKKYIGVKIVEAMPMTKQCFCEDRNLPFTDQNDQYGYMVRYPDGYESWCPKEAFEEANRPTTGMPFGHAIEAAKKGHKIARAGWNGKAQYVFLQYLTVAQQAEIANEHKAGDVCPCLCIKTTIGVVQVGWLATQSDMLCDDWCIVDEEAQQG